MRRIGFLSVKKRQSMAKGVVISASFIAAALPAAFAASARPYWSYQKKKPPL